MIRYPLIAVVVLGLAACSPPAGGSDQAPPEGPATEQANADQAPFTTRALSDLITERGAEAALGDLLATPEDPRWQATLDGISEGDISWMASAAPLVPFFDGEAAESGFAAFAHALALDPVTVLASVGPDGMASVCEPYPPEETAAKQTALMAVPDDSPVVVLRDECLTMLSGEPT